MPTTSQRIVLLGPVFSEKVAAAKAKWIFKLAESDLSRKSCDHLSDTFQSMFSDSEIAKQFPMASQKASHVIQNRIELLLENDRCRSLSKPEGAFILMFDETTTVQRKRKMDMLVRF